MSDKPTKLTKNQEIIANAVLYRSELMRKLLDAGNRNLGQDCGYPDVISIEQYKEMYDREGFGQRVVSLMAAECWTQPFEAYETEDPEETEWEQAWKKLREDSNLSPMYYLANLDELAGLGTFGIMLFGLNDNLPLDQPVKGVEEWLTKKGRGEEVGPPNNSYKLLYLSVFSEYETRIISYETNDKSPRFGMPTMYDISIAAPGQGSAGGQAASHANLPNANIKVHWTRVLHFADNCKASKVFGTPRMQPVFNRLLDLRKLLGGSAEMFWKGAFPGYAFELDPELNASDVDMDPDEIKEQFRSFQDGLQRYMSVMGVRVNSLAPQVADPAAHVMEQLRAIAMTLEIPLRIFMGTEEAKLAGDQDGTNWNKRLTRRQVQNLTPRLVRPFIDRCMVYGALPYIEEYFANWPDLNSPSDLDKAAVAEKITLALANYVKGQIAAIIPPLEFLVHILGFDQEQAEEMLEQMIEENILLAGPGGPNEEADREFQREQSEGDKEFQRKQGESDKEFAAKEAAADRKLAAHKPPPAKR